MLDTQNQSRSWKWWNQPCGGREVLRYAIPLIISAGSISLMTFTDRMFLMWFSPRAMAASMQAGMFFWTLIALPMGIAAYTNAFVSQYHGSGHHHRIGPAVWQGVGLGLVLTPFLLLFTPLYKSVFIFFGHSPDLVVLEDSYLRLILYGSGPVIATEALATFFYGRGKMRVVMNVNIFFVLLNILLDYCLIFGVGGFPAWGLEGAAIATVIAQWGRLLVMIALMFLADSQEKRFCVFSGMKVDFQLLGRMLYYGGAGSIPTLVDTAAFTCFLMQIGGLGEAEHDATTIAFTLNILTFLPIVGTGIAVTTLVGNQLGKNRPDLAQRATLTAVLIGTVYSAFFGLLFLLFPNQLLSGFAAFTSPDEFAKIQLITTYLLRFVALYLLLDGLCIIFTSAIKGAGDTWFVMVVTGIMAPFVPLGSWIGIHCFGFGLYWCWIVLTVWVYVLGLIFAWRFFQGKWKDMRVIEKELCE